MAHPGPSNFRALDGTKLQTHIDNANPLSKDKLDNLVKTLPFGKIFQELWGSENVWYFAEEILQKKMVTAVEGLGIKTQLTFHGLVNIGVILGLLFNRYPKKFVRNYSWIS